MHAAILSIIICSFVCLSAAAENRAAFVVGNANYEHASQLANPENDAELVATTLERLGFDVTLVKNGSRAVIAHELSGFLGRSGQADLTVFYFAGHGMQFEGENYLLGTDAQLKTRFDVQAETIRLEQVVDQLKQNSRAALVFIDACRDNPLAEAFYRSNYSETRAYSTRGLALVSRRHQGAMLMFAASPGQVAYDGQNDNSPFSEALARHLPAENVEILTLMKRIIRDVKTDTSEQQIPMVVNDLSLEIYLNLSEGGQGAAILATQEEAMFEAAIAINTLRAWNVFLKRFPTGTLRDMALAARDELELADLMGGTDRTVSNDDRISIPVQVAENAERSLGLSRDDARKVQASLNSRGYDAGPEDGAIGPRTRRAISDFQAAVGLPATGVVTTGTAEKLQVRLETEETGDRPTVSSRNARRYDPKQLELVENDQRLVAAANVLKGREFVYGYFEGRVYIVVLTWGAIKFDAAASIAAQMDGHLAAITSAEENAFIYELVRHDNRMWRSSSGGGEDRFGPAFGLKQLPDSREPDGGFVWQTGEPLGYQNWGTGEPNNYDNNERIAAFTVRGRSRLPDTATGPWWSDMPDIERAFVIEIE